MSNAVAILIVEDEMIIGANTSMLLSDLGYETLGIIPSFREHCELDCQSC